MGHRPPPDKPWPRLLSAADVCAYLGHAFSSDRLKELKAAGIVPEKVFRMKYDRAVIDRNLDRLSGLSPTPPEQP